MTEMICYSCEGAKGWWKEDDEIPFGESEDQHREFVECGACGGLGLMTKAEYDRHKAEDISQEFVPDPDHPEIPF